MKNAIKELKNRPILLLGGFAAVTVAMILLSHLTLHIPLVPVCTIVILEVLMCALLGRIPVWVHGLFIIAGIVGGIVLGKTVFMVLMAIVYFMAILFLSVWWSQES